jgi:hypothetical protein
MTVVQSHDSPVSTQRVGDSLQLTHEGSSNAHHFVACTPCLVPGTQSSWKVTINKLRNNHWLFLGLIGLAGNNSSGTGGWTHFTEGECLHFCLDGAKLTMFRVIKNERFVIDNIPAGDKFIWFNFYSRGTKVTLGPLYADEYAKLVVV